MSAQTPELQSRPRSESPPPGALPRVLRGLPPNGALSLDEHLDVHGPAPALSPRHAASTLIDELERAGLTGRGGAAFPTARKVLAASKRRGRPVVVVNATEGEPASEKDHALACLVPHLVLDGALLCARALRAEAVLVAACESDLQAMASLARAIRERAPRNGDENAVELCAVPSGFVTGEESALIDRLDGGPGRPRFAPPTWERGVAGRPTLSSNPETFAHLALIWRHGADWFRELGTPAEPGSALVTLGGPVADPGVFEIEIGTSVGSLTQAAGGLTANVGAALVGGYGGAWVRAAGLADVPLSNAGLAPYGASLGSGVVVLLDSHACPVAETARLLRWLAVESAGQCGPCTHGLPAIAGEFAAIAAGMPAGAYERRLEHLAAVVEGRGACRHPDGAVRLARSALSAFPDRLADHARHGPCDACRAEPTLPLPEALG